MITTKYSELVDRMTYDEMRKQCHTSPMQNRNLCRLFMMLLFLSKYANKNDIIVCTGLTSGTHIKILSQLYPKCQFELWDYIEYEVPMTPNVTSHRGILTAEDAKRYTKNGKKTLFISNLRSWHERRKDHETTVKNDAIVMNDMKMQLDACRAMNPKIALLRFRLPWIPTTCEYITGTMYLRPYGSLSTDTMMSTSDYETTVTYDSQEYDEKLAAHHLSATCSVPEDNRWTNLINQYGIKNRWDNIYSLYITYMYLSTRKDFPQDIQKQHLDTINMFVELVESQDTIYKIATRTVFSQD